MTTYSSTQGALRSWAGSHASVVDARSGQQVGVAAGVAPLAFDWVDAPADAAGEFPWFVPANVHITAVEVLATDADTSATADVDLPAYNGLSAVSIASAQAIDSVGAMSLAATVLHSGGQARPVTITPSGASAGQTVTLRFHYTPAPAQGQT